MKKHNDETLGKVLSEDFLTDDNELTTSESSTRYYTFCIVTYALDVEIEDFLNVGIVSNYAYILHDKDNTDPHYHILFTTKANYTCKNIVKIFNECCPSDQNTFCRPVSKSTTGAYQYLTHSTDRAKEQLKHQYSEDEIVTNNSSRWAKVQNEGLSVDEFCDDLFADDININAMCRKYGRDFMRNIKAYMYCRELEKSDRKDK